MNKKNKTKGFSLRQLHNIANQLRRDVIKMLLEAGSGHAAGSLDLAEVMSAMYFHVLNHNPNKPNWNKRDRLFLSCGHVAPIRYAAMIKAGYLPKKELKNLRKFKSPLQGHPSLHNWLAVEHSSGPLGQGLSVAVGAAIADQMNKQKRWTYCVLSDGEMQEGQIWEAAMLASKYRLYNLIALVDRNNIQISGHTEDVMPIESLKAKWEAFNWHVLEIDGHNIEQIIDAINHGKAIFEKPTIVICHTIPGKGVDFMEFEPEWHGKAPMKSEANKALKQLSSLGGKINCEHE